MESFVSEINAKWCEPNAGDDWSHMHFYKTDRASTYSKKMPDTGLYRLMPSGEAVLVKKCNDRTLVQRADEFFFVREMPADTVLKYFNQLGGVPFFCCFPFPPNPPM